MKKLLFLLALLFASPALAQFADQRQYAPTSGGSANIQTVAIPNYNLNVGVVVRFIPGFTNTGPTTLSVDGGIAKAVLKQTSGGLAALTGGEIVAGQVSEVLYDGTRYELLNASLYLALTGGTLSGTLTGADAGTWGSGGINGSIIGGTTAAGGSFTTLNVSSGRINGYFGTDNLAVGTNSLPATATGSYNSAFGVIALQSNTTGSYNLAVGYDALVNNTTGSYNLAVGSNALVNNTTGSYNTAGGAAALYNMGEVATAGSFIVGISYTIFSVGTTDFTLIGAAANTVGTVFTATGVGSGTGTASPNVNNNTVIGDNSGVNIIYGSNNTILGANFLAAAGTTGAVVLATGDGTARADYNYTNSGAWTFPTAGVIFGGAVTMSGLMTVPGNTTATNLAASPPANTIAMNGGGPYIQVCPSTGCTTYTADDSTPFTAAFLQMDGNRGPAIPQYGLVMNEVFTPAGTVTSRRPTTAYSAGAIVLANGNVYTASIGGTSSAGSGPVCTIGTCTDGSVTWSFTSPGINMNYVGFAVATVGNSSGPYSMWGGAIDIVLPTQTLTSANAMAFASDLELDMTVPNSPSGGQCTPISGYTNCFGLFLGQGTNGIPVTAGIGFNGGDHMYYAVLVQGAIVDATFDDETTGGTYGYCTGCLAGGGVNLHSGGDFATFTASPVGFQMAGSHSSEAYVDISTSGAAAYYQGSYSVDALIINNSSGSGGAISVSAGAGNSVIFNAGFYINNAPSSGGTKYLCLNSSNQVVAQAGAC